MNTAYMCHPPQHTPRAVSAGAAHRQAQAGKVSRPWHTCHITRLVPRGAAASPARSPCRRCPPLPTVFPGPSHLNRDNLEYRVAPTVHAWMHGAILYPVHSPCRRCPPTGALRTPTGALRTPNGASWQCCMLCPMPRALCAVQLRPLPSHPVGAAHRLSQTHSQQQRESRTPCAPRPRVQAWCTYGPCPLNLSAPPTARRKPARFENPVSTPHYVPYHTPRAP